MNLFLASAPFFVPLWNNVKVNLFLRLYKIILGPTAVYHCCSMWKFQNKSFNYLTFLRFNIELKGCHEVAHSYNKMVLWLVHHSSQIQMIVKATSEFWNLFL